jgi:DNA-binding YbaB/EbfC family protein
MNLGNIGGLLKQAKQLEKKTKDAQQKLKDTVLVGTAGGGVIKLSLTGDFAFKGIEIDPSVLEGADSEMVEDLIAVAIEDALKQASEERDKVMGSVTGGMGMPGMPGMF